MTPVTPPFDLKANKALIQAIHINNKNHKIMSTQVKTKEDFKRKQQQAEREYRQKQKNPNHIVTPNLTPRGLDIMRRLQNKSLDVTGDKSYTLDERMVNARMKSKHELIQEAKDNKENINNLKSKLDDNNKKIAEAEREARIKAKLAESKQPDGGRKDDNPSGGSDKKG